MAEDSPSLKDIDFSGWMDRYMKMMGGAAARQCAGQPSHRLRRSREGANNRTWHTSARLRQLP